MKATDKVKRVQRTIDFLEACAHERQSSSQYSLAESADSDVEVAP